VTGRDLCLDDIELGVERVAELHERGAIQLVDVREPDEWRAVRIPGARHIELEQLVSSAGAIPRDVPVVFCCRFGSRGGLAAAAFRRAGYDAYSLVGGIVAWRTRGLAVETAASVPSS
jgi:rhodanese-related sulfurtransferase